MQRGKTIYYVLMGLFVIDCTLPFLLGYFYEGYDHKTMLLSALGNESSPVHMAYRTWMAILGIGIVLGGICIYRHLKDISMTLTVFLVMIMFCYGIFDCIVSCFFEIGESKEMISMAAKIHGIGSAVGSTLFLFCGLFIGKLFLVKGEVSAARSCFMVFIGAIILFGLFIASDKPELKDSIGSYEGIWQRLSYAMMYVPFMILSFHMITKE